MKKHTNQLFLYKYRFIIGYGALMIALFGLLSFLPSIAPGGISTDEMNSAATADSITPTAISTGNVINLPYYLLQKLCFRLFGLTLYSIKLPSIIIAVLAALFIILLLNRWFKSDVAIIGSILTTLSTAFLFLAGSGTPNIMYIFWLALILWLGSKIVGNNHVPPLLFISFFICVGLSLYTPLLCYVALAIAIAGIIHPHLRFAVTQVKTYQFVISIAIFVLIILPLILSCIFSPSIISKLVFMDNFSLKTYLGNIATAFAPFFSFVYICDSIYLSPVFGLATVALIFIGALASIGQLFTSRNTVVGLLVIFAILVSGLQPHVAISIIVPIAILTAAGLESIIEKWHSLFPENPYAHFFGTLPVIVVILIIVVSGLTHFIFGYHYSAKVAKNFSNDITLINKNLDNGAILIVSEDNVNFDFYKLFEKYSNITVLSKLPERSDAPIAVLGSPEPKTDNLKLVKIITSPKSRNSDRLYIYEKVSQ